MTSKEPDALQIGERLSLKGQTCTVRYVGPVGDKAGTWLGVEWDDPKRGKHNGSFHGKKYFDCRSKAPTAASFLKPKQSWDEPRSFLAALREKYMPEFHRNEAEIVYISGKEAEEVGFEKFSQRQSKLHGIRVLVLDCMRISHRHTLPTLTAESSAIRDLCSEITDLDLSGNLFRTFDEIYDLCSLLPRLRVLNLDGNRFSVSSGRANTHDSSSTPFTNIRTLNLSRTLLHADELERILSYFPNLEDLTFSENEIVGPVEVRSFKPLTRLDLSDNMLTELSALQPLIKNCPHTLILKRNAIRAMGSNFTLPITELDVAYNDISDWMFFNSITTQKFPNLKHLRVTGSPLYKDLVSAEGKPLTAEDGYMLTLARAPQLQSLNYAKITDKERLNAETYYLGQIAAELARVAEGKEAEALADHPRYRELCEEYGEPVIRRQLNQGSEVMPNSLAASLIAFSFALAPRVLPHVRQRSWTQEIPRSFNVYALLGQVGKRLDVMPLRLRLVLETDERDPRGSSRDYVGPEWWDSSDEGEELSEDAGWVRREVELVAGTRAIGTYVEGRTATARVETIDEVV